MTSEWYYELRCGNEVLDRNEDPDKLDWEWAYKHGYSEEDLEVVLKEYNVIYDCRPED